MNADSSHPSSKQTFQSNYKVHLVWGSVFIATCSLVVIALKTANDAVIDDIKKGNEIIVGDLKRAHDVLAMDAKAAVAKLEEYGRKGIEEAKAIAAKFKTGTITETFKAESPIFEFIKVGRLEVAVEESVETFKSKDEQKYLWDWVSAGTTVSEIKVPATFRYHLDMAEDWKIEVKDNCCIVHAPSLKPSLPVAIQTDKMEKKSETGWARFDGTEQMEKLEKRITPRLNNWASDPGHMDSARKEARDVVARFVRTWLLNSGQWQNDRFTSITVIFANETVDEVTLKPTLTIDVVP